MAPRHIQQIFNSIAPTFPLWQVFDYCELTENMRQKEDLEFANMMARMRVENLKEEDHLEFKKRLINGNIFFFLFY